MTMTPIPDLDPELLREFLIETSENLARLDNEIIELEKRPGDADLLASIFRTIHTVKGTCGFLGFAKLEAITHEGETILSQVRAGQRPVTAGLITLVLDVMDATRKILRWLEEAQSEGPEGFEDLIERLREAALSGNDPVPVVAAPPAAALPANAAAVSQATAETERVSSAADSTIRIEVGLLDRLMNMVGELVLVRNQILLHGAGTDQNTAQRLNLITSELQEGVMKARMQPIGLVWGKLPRVVRDLAHALGKQIQLEMEGAETELDKTIIEAIKDPLTHLVRNSCDHGVERPEARVAAGKLAKGRIVLRAYHEGGQVNIEIDDDGAGVDIERVKRKAVDKGILTAEQAQRLSERDACGLIFEPGFSTAAAVTNVSGRGVGMDVVKSNIERIGGVVDIVNRAGAGATVRLKIPLTLAIVPGLVVETAGHRFVIPQASLLELIRLESAGQLETIQGTRVYRRRGSLLPVVPLAEVLALAGEGLDAARRGRPLNLIVLQSEERVFGLVVDKIHDTQEIVVKPLGQRIKSLAVYAGATIMGDGRVALIVDVAGVAQRAGLQRGTAQATGGEKAAADATVQRWLLIRAGENGRLAIPVSMVSRLEEVPRERMERAGGRSVLQYRGGILPLLALGELLGGTGGEASVIPTIVFQDGRQALGLMVDQILDVVEEAVTVRQKHDRPYLLGSAVIGGQVTDLVDLRAVLETASAGWEPGPAKMQVRVLVAERNALERGLVRSRLEMAGYEVCEAGTASEMLRLLDQRPVDLLMASPEVAGAELLAKRPVAPPLLPLTAELMRLGGAMLGPVEESLKAPLGAQPQ